MPDQEQNDQHKRPGRALSDSSGSEKVLTGTPEWEAFKKKFEEEMCPILKKQDAARARSAVAAMHKIILQNTETRQPTED